MEMFRDPNSHLDYLRSSQFARDILTLSNKVKPVLESEPRCIFLQSPCYVFGDIHGNLEDLHFFSDNIWRLGMSLTAGNFLFLGDRVTCPVQVSQHGAMTGENVGARISSS